MTPDQLRALADALQQDIDELRLLAPGELTAADEAWFAMHDKAIACLLACADAQPVGMLTVATFRGHLENRDFDYTGDLPDGNYPLYTHPAPVAPQAEPKREPNPDEVICPACTHQFRAIPENVQVQLWALDDVQIGTLSTQGLFASMHPMDVAEAVRLVERAHGIGGSDAE